MWSTCNAETLLSGRGNAHTLPAGAFSASQILLLPTRMANCWDSSPRSAFRRFRSRYPQLGGLFYILCGSCDARMMPVGL